MGRSPTGIAFQTATQRFTAMSKVSKRETAGSHRSPKNPGTESDGGALYLDDRICVFHLAPCTTEVTGDGLMETIVFLGTPPAEHRWCILTLLNTEHYPPKRVDHFDLYEMAVEYLKVVEPATPLRSLGCESPGHPLPYSEWIEWKRRKNLREFDYRPFFPLGVRNPRFKLVLRASDGVWAPTQFEKQAEPRDNVDFGHVSRICSAIEKAVLEIGIEEPNIRLTRPDDPSYGDWATNVAFSLARRLGRPPRDVAEEIVNRIPQADLEQVSVEVAGSGFLNFRLASRALAEIIPLILDQDRAFGRTYAGSGLLIMVEFVSANPTGPLHLGHGRQAALGDAISSLLEWTGSAVHREYYYNDAGGQIDLLAESVWARYQQLTGEEVGFPATGYQGEYITELARGLVSAEGDRFRRDRSPQTMAFVEGFAVQSLREEQHRDLQDFGVRFDRYVLESSLHDDGLVDATLDALRKTGMVYERDGALWLRTTDVGDQEDRVMVKGDGTPTYSLTDVAYHMAKRKRGFVHAINIHGADHDSTASRVQAGLQALGVPEGYPEYVIHQMVAVERGGKKVRLSKRAGSFVTLRELMTEVGADVARYFFLMRKPETHLVFDLDLALDQSETNPVFKIQYAHARMCSIFKKAGLEECEIDAGGAALERLSNPLERDLLRRFSDFPDTIRRAADARAPHVLCDYLEKTAGAVNAWYHAGNPSRNPDLAVLVGDSQTRKARLALARSARIVLRNGLLILGISAPAHMERLDNPDPVNPNAAG
jgi:arginyl-tRNA synthetase